MPFYSYTIVCLLILQVTYAEILEEPKNVVYKNTVDSTGTLTCKVRTPLDPASGGVLWIVIKQGLVWSSNGQPLRPEKYSVSADIDTGVYTLTILNLNRNDTDNYLCQVGASVGRATVTVADPPGAAAITVSDDLEENKNAKFTCSSTGAYPKPDFVWAMGEEIILSSGGTLSETGGVSTSEVTIPLTYHHFNKTLTCTVTNILKEIKTDEKVLDVKFRPKVSLSVSGSGSAIAAVEKEKGFTVSCEVLSNPPHTSVSWQKASQSVSVDSLTLNQPDGITVDTEYICTVTNSLGDGSSSLNVAIHYAPIVTIEQGDMVTKNENQRLILTCKADGRPAEISYEWTKDNSDTLETASSNLDMSSVSRTDAGVYTCTARNTLLGTKAASGSKSVEVKINYAPDEPVVQVAPANLEGTYSAGNMATFTCFLPLGGEGNPVATYDWFKEGVKLDKQGKQMVIDVTTYNHSGDYECEASNVVGSKRSSPLSTTFQDVPEFVTSSALEINMTKGDKTNFLKCEYRGIPVPHVMWYYNDNPVAQIDRYNVTETVTSTEEEVYTTTVSVLQFKGTDRDSADEDDTGTYTCKASSEVGESTTEIRFTVTVLFGPEFHSQAKVAADPGAEATITCEVWSNPATSSIALLKNQQEIVSDDSHTVSDMQVISSGKYYKQKRTITFQSVNSADYSEYTCLATSPRENQKQTIVLQRPSQPDAPSDIALVSRSWDSFSVRWTPGFDGGRTQSFVISVDGIEQETTRNTTWTFTRLYPQTNHAIRIEGKNSLGRSQSAATIDVLTDSVAIPTPQVTYNEADKTLTVKQNSTECCVIILGNVEPDAESGVALFDGKCHFVNEQKIFALTAPFYSYYIAKSCIVGREDDVCSTPISTDKIVMKDNVLYIVVGVVGGLLLLILIAAVISYLIIRRRKKKSKLSSKSISPPISNGHINQVMATDEVDAETPYATYSPQNNNLNTFAPQLSPTSNNPAHRESENLDYVYAAVAKKPNNSVKYLNTFNAQQPLAPSAPMDDGYELPRIESPPIESNSDNTEQDTLDDLPVFERDHNLSLVLGGNPLQFRRLSNISESGYSTPDSRAKKVIYEVIV